jgi:hypothetical protein
LSVSPPASTARITVLLQFICIHLKSLTYYIYINISHIDLPGFILIYSFCVGNSVGSKH